MERKTMKQFKMFLLFIFALLILAPTSGRAEIYLGAYAGINWAGEMNPDFEFYARSPQGLIDPGIDPHRYVYAIRNAKGIGVDPAAIFGGKIGYWFTRESVFGVKMPTWLKYLGFELDVSYNNLNWPSKNVRVDPLNQKYVIENTGYGITVAFLFMGRYGFLKDSEVPFGRLQPYIGIGPVVYFSTQKLNIGRDFTSTEGDLGYAIESGISYMLRKNISVNMAFRYRFIPNHLDVDDMIFDQPLIRYIVMRTNFNLYDVTFGVAYHF
jgi:opacity protein-like surface antigen